METTVLSIVIPAFNTGAHLNGLIASLIGYFQPKLSFEIIVVDDSGDEKSHLSFSVPQIKYYKLKQNYGQHAATYFGITKAQGNHILTIDDDVILSEKNLHIIYHSIQQPYDLQYFTNDYYLFKDRVKFFIIKSFFRYVTLVKPPKYGTSQRLFTQELAQKIITQNYSYAYVDVMLMRHSKDRVSVINYIAKNKLPQLKSRYNLQNRLFLLSNTFIFHSPLAVKLCYLLILIALGFVLFQVSMTLVILLLAIFTILAVFCLWGYATVVKPRNVQEI